MRVRRPRRVLLCLPALTLGLGLGLGACGDPVTPTPTSPVPSTSAPSSPAPASPAPGRALAVPDGSVGSDGLTVRYLGDDGSVKTVRVEDFPR